MDHSSEHRSLELKSLGTALPLIPISEIDQVEQSEINTDFSRMVVGVANQDPAVLNNIERHYDHLRGRLLRPLLRHLFNLFREDTPFVFQNSLAVEETRSAETNPFFSRRALNNYGNGAKGNAPFETLRDEITDNDEDLRVSRLSSRVLERVFTEARGS